MWRQSQLTRQQKDTLFKPIDNGVAPLDVAVASNSVLQKMGGSTEAAKQRYAGDIAAMQKSLTPTVKVINAPTPAVNGRLRT